MGSAVGYNNNNTIKNATATTTKQVPHEENKKQTHAAIAKRLPASPDSSKCRPLHDKRNSQALSVRRNGHGVGYK
jgi:hypothetical protein